MKTETTLSPRALLAEALGVNVAGLERHGERLTPYHVLDCAICTIRMELEHIANNLDDRNPDEAPLACSMTGIVKRLDVARDFAALLKDEAGSAASAGQAEAKGKGPAEAAGAELPKETITLTIPVRVLECLWAGGNYSTATLPLADAVAMNALCHAAWMADLLWKSEAADDRNHYGAFQLEMAEELIAAIRKAEGGPGERAS